MKINKKNCNCAGIYVIKNSINGKVYVGKSKNCYTRLHQHLTDIKYENRNYNENPHLLNAFKKYGHDNFEYYIVEKIDINDNTEKELSEKELLSIYFCSYLNIAMFICFDLNVYNIIVYIY